MRAAFGGGRRNEDKSGQSIIDQLSERAGSSLRLHLVDEDPRSSPIITVSKKQASLGSSRYQLLGEIARGGVGIVFNARDVDLGRDVAIKVLHEDLRDREDILQRFVEEAQIGGQLQHPGIVPVYEMGLQDGERPFFAMKLVKGKTLASILERRESVAQDRASLLTKFEQVCQTMSYAHSRGVVHRDLKPANVMVGAFGEVQIVDWGFAKVMARGGVADEQRAREPKRDVSVIETLRSQGAGSQSLVGSVMGTPAYMPPEQALGDVERMDERSDVFALGAILCEILIGRPPYIGGDEQELNLVAQAAQCKLDDVFALLEERNIDSALVELTKACLSPSRLARPRDAGLVAKQIHHYLVSVEERAHAAELAATEQAIHAEEERRRRKLTLGLVASILFTVIGASGFYIWHKEGERVRFEAAEVRVRALQTDAVTLAGNAASLPPHTAVAKWEAAISAAKSALKQARDTLPDTGWNRELEQLVATTQQHRADVVTRAERRRLQESLIAGMPASRLPKSFSRDSIRHFRAMDEANTRLMQRHGIDIDRIDEHELFAMLDGEHNAVIAGCLDRWAVVRRQRLLEDKTGWHERVKRLIDLAVMFDPGDDIRKQMRNLLLSKKVARRQMQEFAATLDPEELRAETALVVGSYLDFGKRIALLEPVVRRFPENWSIHHELATCYLEMGSRNSERAYAHALAAAVLLPSSGWLHRSVSLSLLRMDPESAVTWARRAIALEPDLAAAHDTLGAALIGLHDLVNAEAAVREAIRLAPDYGNAHGRLAIIKTRQNELDEAVAEARKAVRSKSASWFAYMAAGFALTKAREFAEAVELLREAVRRAPGRFECRAQLGNSLRQSGDYAAAVEVLEEAAMSFPDAASIRSQIAWVYCNRRQHEKAITAFRAAIRMWRKSDGIRELAITHSSLGSTLLAVGRHDEAEREFRRAIEIDPGYQLAHANLALRLANQKNFAEASRIAFRVLKENPKIALCHSTLGEICFEQKEYEAAREHFERAVATSGSSRNWIADNERSLRSYYYRRLADTRSELQDQAGSIRDYRKAIECDPTKKEAYINLSVDYERQGLYEAGLALMQQGVAAVVPESSDVFFRLATFLRLCGDIDGGLRALAHAIEMDPDNAAQHNEIAVLYGLRQDYVRALQHSTRAIELGRPESTLAAKPARIREMLAEQTRLLRIVSGELKAGSAKERAEAATAAFYTGRYVKAFELFAQALREDEKLATSASRFRYLAACARIQAAVGEDPAMTPALRRASRRRGLNLMRADLAAVRTTAKSAKSEAEAVRHALAVMLRSMRTDAWLAPVRDKEKLAKLPAIEIEVWTRFWSQVAKLHAELRR